MKHILHALRFLRPGGRLVAVASAGVSFRTTKLYKQLRDLADEITPLPDGAFQPAGTEVRTVMVTATRATSKPARIKVCASVDLVGKR